MTDFALGDGEDWNRETIFTRNVARRDHELFTLRALWEACPDPAELKLALRAIHEAEKRVRALTGHLLGGAALKTNRELGDLLARGADANPGLDPGPRVDAFRAAAGLTADAQVSAGEVLCAIGCWEADEPYLPRLVSASHPRWPDPDERAVALAIMKDCGISTAEPTDGDE